MCWISLSSKLSLPPFVLTFLSSLVSEVFRQLLSSSVPSGVQVEGALDWNLQMWFLILAWLHPHLGGLEVALWSPGTRWHSVEVTKPLSRLITLVALLASLPPPESWSPPSFLPGNSSRETSEVTLTDDFPNPTSPELSDLRVCSLPLERHPAHQVFQNPSTARRVLVPPVIPVTSSYNSHPVLIYLPPFDSLKGLMMRIPTPLRMESSLPGPHLL